ncbi:MFS family permease [Kitasatospora sp. MAA4]|uniref:MFS transporter n=1 Tax=Kitasatospora sp. MAA4 TaxID=3035093 RepID=UPI00247619A0|nr:MFS transporter [Kitasatospora sp. MAA4]MDH6135823.1 MFS family permease [Kitasatospora sp. MAA4]
MDSSSAAPRPQRGLRNALGLPDLTGNGRFLSANIIDSLGNGLVLAFTLVYFTRTTTLPLVEIGAALTLGQLLSLPAPALVGPLLDRIGPRAIVAVGNLVSAVGFLGFLFSDTLWLIVVFQVVVQIGSNLYWTSSRSLVVLAAANSGERQRWFAMIGALRNIGAGFGAAVAALMVQFAGADGLRAVLLANTGTFLLAAWLIQSWRPAGEAPKASTGAGAEAAPAGGYLDVLKDTAYLRLVGANLGLVFAGMVLPVLLAVYATEALHAPAWIVGVLVVLNTALVAGTQTLVNRWGERFRPNRLLALAGVVNAVSFTVFGALGSLPSWAMEVGLVLAVLVYTLGEMLSGPPSNELSVAMAQDHIQGRYQAAFQLSWTLGGALSPVLLTALLARGPLWPWIFLGAFSLLSVLLVQGLGPRPAQQQDSEQPVRQEV